LHKFAVLSLILMSSTIAVAIWSGEVMWIVTSLIGIVAIVIPPLIKKDIKTTYHSKLIKMASIPLVLYLVLSTFQFYHPLQSHRTISLYLQTAALVFFGYLIMVSIDINTETVLSKRWMLLLSIAFACSLTILHTFFQYYYMLVSGYPVTNEDLIGISVTQSNRILMAPMLVGSIASAVNAIILRRYLRAVPKSELSTYYGGEETG